MEALPVMISGTITDLSGRTLSGQTAEAFWNCVRHAKPFSIGFNCALGADVMRPIIAELSRVADTLVCAYPNAGLPNALGQYDEEPHETAHFIEECAASGLVNIVGGCCGTTPDHIRAIAEAVARMPRATSRNVRSPCGCRGGSNPLNWWRDGYPLPLPPTLSPLPPAPTHIPRHPPSPIASTCRRAHQRHRLGQIPQADHHRRLCRRARRGARPGRERRPGHRHQHGRGPARLRSRR